MSAVETSMFSSDAYVQDLLRAAEAQSPSRTKFSRRDFFKVSGLAGGGLVLAFYMGEQGTALANAKGKEFAPNAFLRITPEGVITLYSKAPEIGQGIKTAFPMIIAEELDADWAHVRVEQAPINPAVYGRQSAGGSRSIPTSWDQLRRAGAVGRAMLVSAAAKQWNVPESECTTDKSTVFHQGSNRQLSYAKLASAAAEVPVPDEKSLTL